MNGLLAEAVCLGASDLHLSAGAVPVVRVDGALRPLARSVVSAEQMEELLRSLLNGPRLARLQSVGDVDFSHSLPGLSRFRVNVFQQWDGLGAAIRVIPNHVPTPEALGLPAVLTELAERRQGLLLVTGPTGSGKSTTLAALIAHINRTAGKHIVTLEDPIEYVHRPQRSLVQQREVGRDTRSFADGLRAALRQDPDVLLIGELRDLETIQTALTAAETGHLVLATLHTMGAVQTIERLVDVFPPHQQAQVRMQLASVLVGVASQQLLPRQGGGRVAAFEVMVNTPAVANLVRSGPLHQLTTVIQTSRQLGMHTLETHIRELAQAGVLAP
ncbi:MAG: type IV pilus twitching motility protein PilT [Alicyclobacillus sp.]|nr:type IV pilus twitching motility protein PilT [Alicyclobacillus sp.]